MSSELRRCSHKIGEIAKLCPQKRSPHMLLHIRVCGDDAGDNLSSPGAAAAAVPMLDKEGFLTVCAFVLLVFRLIADGGVRIAPYARHNLRAAVMELTALRYSVSHRGGQTA